MKEHTFYGREKENLIYYDLSERKVTKRKPLALEYFGDFFTRLPKHEDSEWSWTVDMVARKEQAAAEAKPFHDQAREKKQAAARWKEQLTELKKPKQKEWDRDAIEKAEIRIEESTKEAPY